MPRIDDDYDPHMAAMGQLIRHLEDVERRIPPAVNGALWKQLAGAFAILLMSVLSWAVMQTVNHSAHLATHSAELSRMHQAITRMDVEVLRIGQIQASRTSPVEGMRQVGQEVQALDRRVSAVESQTRETAQQVAARLETMSKRILSLAERLDKVTPQRGSEWAPEGDWPVR